MEHTKEPWNFGGTPVDEQDVTLELQAPAWAKGPYGASPEGWERSSAPFRAKDEIEFLRNRLVVIEKQRDDLLAALEELSLYVAYNGDTWVQNKARAAIAKAEGVEE